MPFECSVLSNGHQYKNISQFVAKLIIKQNQCVGKRLIVEDILIGNKNEIIYTIPEGFVFSFDFTPLSEEEKNNNKLNLNYKYEANPKSNPKSKPKESSKPSFTIQSNNEQTSNNSNNTNNTNNTKYPYTAEVKKISNDHGGYDSVVILHELILSAPDKESMEELLYETDDHDSSIDIHHYNGKNWQFMNELQRRSIDTVILNDDVKEKITEDLQMFLSSEEDYYKYGINYKRNYMFSGKPGSGKTSLANVIASITNRSIYIISFDAEMTDNAFHDAISSIRASRAILLLEDIDCIFQDRNTNQNNSRISFSALLNILDGVNRNKSMITIMTTNYIEKLDIALVRVGRIDLHIKFEHLDRKQIIGFFSFFNVEQSPDLIDYFEKVCNLKELTACVLSGFLFSHRKLILTNKQRIEKFDKYLKEHIIEVNTIPDEISHIYM